MAVDLFLCFFFFFVSVVNPTFTMILNQMMDILWQTAAAVSNSATRRAWTFKLKFFEMGNTTYNGNALFAEISYLNYITYVMKIRVYLWRPCVIFLHTRLLQINPLFLLYKLYNSDNLFLKEKHFRCMWYFPSQKTLFWMFMLFLWYCSTQPLQFATKDQSSDLISSWK